MQTPEHCSRNSESDPFNYVQPMKVIALFASLFQCDVFALPLLFLHLFLLLHVDLICANKKTNNAQSNLRTAASQSPHYISYNGTPQIHPPNFPRRSRPPSNTPIPRPTPLTFPNSIRIHSAVSPQYTLRTDKPIDRQTNRPTNMLRHISRLIESDAANNYLLAYLLSYLLTSGR